MLVICYGILTQNTDNPYQVTGGLLCQGPNEP